MIWYLYSHYCDPCKKFRSQHAGMRRPHVCLIVIIIFVLVHWKCPLCMLDQPVGKSNIIEVQGELHPEHFPLTERACIYLSKNKQITLDNNNIGLILKAWNKYRFKPSLHR